MTKTLKKFGSRAVSILCTFALCTAFIPAAAIPAYASEEGGAIEEWTQFSADCPFVPTDPESEVTSVKLYFTIDSYDIDSNTGTVVVGRVTSTGGNSGNGNALPAAYAGAITIPDSITYEGATFTPTSLAQHAFDDATKVAGITGLTLPNTLQTIGESALLGVACSKLVVPESLTTFAGRYNFGAISSGGNVVSTIEWKGDCSEILCENSYSFIKNAANKTINHICWGDCGIKLGGTIENTFGPVYNGSTYPMYLGSYNNAINNLWFPVTYYPSEQDAIAGTNAIGTAYISWNKSQTNAGTVLSTAFTTDNNVKLSEIANMTLKGAEDTAETGNSYFLNYSDGVHTTLTDYPSLPQGMDKWVFLGSPNMNNTITSGLSCYPVVTNDKDLTQCYYTGAKTDEGTYEALESSFLVTGEDIEPEIHVFTSAGTEISTENYTISYQKKEGNNWVDASAAGAHKEFDATYRMVITGVGDYTGSITTANYRVRGYEVGDIITYKIKHVSTGGEEDTVDCKFKVLTEATAVAPATVAVGTGSAITSGEQDEQHAIVTSVTGTVEIPSSFEILGITYNVTRVAGNAFGVSNSQKTSASTLACQISRVILNEGITAIEANALSYCPNINYYNVPASVTSLAAQSMLRDDTFANACAKGLHLSGNLSRFTSASMWASNAVIFRNRIDFLLDGDANLNANATVQQYWHCGANYFYAVNVEQGDSTSTVYVPEGTSISDLISGTVTDVRDAEDNATSLSLPASATAWVVKDNGGYTLGEDIDCGGKVTIAASTAEATNLATAHLVGFESENWYVGSDITPTVTVASATGETIAPENYTVAYEFDNEGTWQTATEGSRTAVGTYRVVVTAKEESSYTGSITAEYKISRPTPGQAVYANVTNVTAGGTTQEIPMLFTVLTAGESGSAGTVAVGDRSDLTAAYTAEYKGAKRAVAIDTTGSVTIPEKITIGDADYKVTVIAAAAFKGIKGITNVDMPEGITDICKDAFDTVSLKRVVIPSTVVNLGKAFCRTCSDTTKATDAGGTIEEVVFKGLARLKATDTATSSFSISSNYFNNINNTKFSVIFEGETATRTITISTISTLKTNIYFKANVYKNRAAAEDEDEPLATVYIKKGSTTANAASNLYQGDYATTKVLPSLPAESGESGSWIYTGVDGAATTTINFCQTIYASSPANSLANYSFENSIKDTIYTWTGSAITPDFGNIIASDGQVLASNMYVVSYQYKNEEGEWVDTESAIDEGTYRIVISPAEESGLIDVLYSKTFTIEKVEDPTISYFNVPVLYKGADGSKKYINATFLALNDTTAMIAGKSTAQWNSKDGEILGVPGIDVPTYAGDLYIPETVNANGNTYTVTTIGSYAFCVSRADGVQVNLHIPESVTTIKNSVYAERTYNQGMSGFAQIWFDGDCNITSISSGSFACSYGWQQYGLIHYSGEVSSYMKSNSVVGKYLAPTSDAKEYALVSYYASKSAYKGGSDPIAKVYVPYGTKVSELVVTNSTVEVSAYGDKIPSLPESMNAWTFDGVKSLDTAIDDGTFVAYAEDADTNDFKVCTAALGDTYYSTTGNDIVPIIDMTNIVSGETVSESEYFRTYQRYEDGAWVNTSDLKSPGTLRIVLTANTESSYSGSTCTNTYTIEAAPNEVGSYFNAQVGYLNKGKIWNSSVEEDRTIGCYFQIIKPASSSEQGLVMVSRSNKTISGETSTNGEDTYPCASTNFDGTIVIPETVSTNAGTYKVVAMGLIMRYSYSGADYTAYQAFKGTTLTGIVVPSSLNYAETTAATSNWYWKPSNTISLGEGATDLLYVYFKSSLDDFTVEMGSSIYTSSATWSKKISYVFAGKKPAVTNENSSNYVGAYANVQFYASAADAEAGTNMLGSARVLTTLNVKNLSTSYNTSSSSVTRDNVKITKYNVFQDGGAIPELPDGKTMWIAYGNYDSNVTVSDLNQKVYAIDGTTDDLSFCTVYNPGVKQDPKLIDSPLVYTLFTNTKAYDGEAIGTDFVLKNRSGQIVDASNYTVKIERQDAQGAWAETTDFTSLGELRITATATQESSYVGSITFTLSITAPETLSVTMPFTPDLGEATTVDVNTQVISVDEATKTITAAIAPTATGKAVTLTEDGTLEILDSATNGSYTINITKVAAGAFGDETQENAVEKLIGVVIPDGIKTIESGAFQKCPCDVTFASGCAATVEANAFAGCGTVAVVFNNDASSMTISDTAFANTNFVETVIFNNKSCELTIGTESTAIYYTVSFYEETEGNEGTPVKSMLLKKGCDPLNLKSGDTYVKDDTIPEPAANHKWVYASTFDSAKGLACSCGIYKDAYTAERAAEIKNLNDCYDADVTSINGLTNLESADKTTALADLGTARDTAINNVNNAVGLDAVQKAGKDGIAAINAVLETAQNLNTAIAGRATAKADLKTAYDSAEATISAFANLTKEQKTTALTDLKTAYDEGIASFANTKTAAENETALANAKKALTDIVAIAQDQNGLGNKKATAKRDLATACDTATGTVNALANLTRAEKQETNATINGAYDDGIVAIEAAENGAGVESALADAQDAMNAAVAKAQLANNLIDAKADIDEAYASATKKIAALTSLTSTEKTKASEKLEGAYNDALEAVEGATSVDDLATVLSAQKEAIESVTNAAVALNKKSAAGYSEIAGSNTSYATYKITSAAKRTVQYVAAYGAAKKATAITIPATVKLSNGKTYKVTSIAAKACFKQTKAKTVSIGKYVTSIGDYAFYGCTALTKASLYGTAVTTIGKSAFSGCSAMTYVTLGSYVKTINAYAFYGCKKMTTVYIYTKSLTQTSMKNLVKSTYIKTLSCKNLTSTLKAKYSKWAKAYKSTITVK